MTAISLTVNGKVVSGNVEDRTLLVHFLREHLNLTGTHVGCDTSQCGACVVHVDGKAVKSCSMLAAQASGSEIVTIEGLADVRPRQKVEASITYADGSVKKVPLICRIDTLDELDYMKNGGILQTVLRDLAA